MPYPGDVYAAPLTALVVACLLGVLGRWIFSPPRRRRGRPRRSALPDYGLLVPVRRTDTPAEADELRALLLGHGVRGTTAPAGRGYDATGRPWPPGATFVLVFPDDAERARALTAQRRSGHPRP